MFFYVCMYEMIYGGYFNCHLLSMYCKPHHSKYYMYVHHTVPFEEMKTQRVIFQDLRINEYKSWGIKPGLSAPEQVLSPHESYSTVFKYQIFL